MCLFWLLLPHTATWNRKQNTKATKYDQTVPQSGSSTTDAGPCRGTYLHSYLCRGWGLAAHAEFGPSLVLTTAGAARAVGMSQAWECRQRTGLYPFFLSAGTWELLKGRASCALRIPLWGFCLFSRQPTELLWAMRGECRELKEL